MKMPDQAGSQMGFPALECRCQAGRLVKVSCRARSRVPDQAFSEVTDRAFSEGQTMRAVGLEGQSLSEGATPGAP